MGSPAERDFVCFTSSDNIHMSSPFGTNSYAELDISCYLRDGPTKISKCLKYGHSTFSDVLKFHEKASFSLSFPIGMSS